MNIALTIDIGWKLFAAIGITLAVVVLAAVARSPEPGSGVGNADDQGRQI